MENHSTLTRSVSEKSVENLNESYRSLSPEQRIERLYRDFDAGEIMLTSSFAATSALLLKLFSDINKDQEIFFIDTGYHFWETLIYKEYLTQLYELKVTDIRADRWKHEQTKDEATWRTDPDKCCHINKVEPLDAIKKNYTVWVSGLMAWQSDHRATLDIFEDRSGILKFYPLLDVTREERDQYIADHHLPFHPLISKGYSSIGCTHCTVPGVCRDGRWNNNPKTECGLHL